VRCALVLCCAVALAAASLHADEVVPAEPSGPRHEDLAPVGPSLETRLAEIQRRVQAAAHYPENARLRGVSGETHVAFEVQPDGTPGEVDLVESSGSVALDRAAVQAVESAGVLPRVIGRVNVPVRFALVDPE